MRTVKRILLAAIAAGIMGAASTAWACEVVGRVVCAGTDTGVSGVVVTLTLNGTYVASATTDANGQFVINIWGGTWEVTLSAGGVVLAEPAVTCSVSGSTIALPTYGAALPGCGIIPPPPTTADCSPGYYKNHPDAWCTQCGYTAAECAALVKDLSTGGSGGAREAAKAEIDACFGTAAASPCADD